MENDVVPLSTTDITVKQHLEDIRAMLPPNTSVNVQMTIYWSKKKQDYVIQSRGYEPGSLLRFNIRSSTPPKKSKGSDIVDF